MPSQTTSPPLTVTVLAALWVSLGRCGVSDSPGPGCDNGKLYLDRDLPPDAVYWRCPVTAWPESPQVCRSVDTVYDPEPARQICMDKSISYNHTIPNSGAYRPVRAESGEYLYCPPQRWLNNLHHAATVLLYHPCAPPHERLLLSALARSCLPDYILTPHPQLSKHMPIALVSWGRTLELSTVASSDVCDWLETSASARDEFGSVTPSRKYSLLLTRSSEQQQQQQQRAHPEEHSAKMKESLGRCCEQTISSLLNGATGSSTKTENLEQINEEGKSRHIRAVVRESEKEGENTTTHSLSSQSNGTALGRTGDGQSHGGTPGASADPPPGSRTLSDPPAPSNAPSQSKIHIINQGLTSRTTTPLRSDILDTHHAPGSEKNRLQAAAQQPKQNLRHPDPSAGSKVLADGANSEHNRTARPEAPPPSSKDEGTDSVKGRVKVNDSKDKHSDKDSAAGGTMKDSDVVDVKERELETKQTHGDTHSHRQSEKTGYDRTQQHPNPRPPTNLPSGDGDGDEGATDVDKGLLRTPRTDEAVWAAAALGFLLILLTLSVLHTRLYRHWRTTPSLYWHDPQRDYDSVADVIRRRLRIAKRRRKRGRRQECVLLPSSSSSDENP